MSFSLFLILMKTTQFSIVFFVLLALCVAGCRKDPFGATRVTGTVTLDGTPVEGVNVAFLPTGGAGMYSRLLRSD